MKEPEWGRGKWKWRWWKTSTQAEDWNTVVDKMARANSSLM
jgi:hypothetical protein